MAVAAALMTMRPDISGREKWVWTVAILLFARIEFRAIAKDRKENYDEQVQDQKEQIENFQGIANRIETGNRQNQDEFKKVQDRFAETAERLNAENTNISALFGQVNVGRSQSSGNLRERALLLSLQILTYMSSFQKGDSSLPFNEQLKHESVFFRAMFFERLVKIRDELATLKYTDDRIDDFIAFEQYQKQLSEKLLAGPAHLNSSPPIIFRGTITDLAEHLTALAKQIKKQDSRVVPLLSVIESPA